MQEESRAAANQPGLAGFTLFSLLPRAQHTGQARGPSQTIALEGQLPGSSGCRGRGLQEKQGGTTGRRMPEQPRRPIQKSQGLAREMLPSYPTESQGALCSLEVSRTKPCMSPACHCDSCHSNTSFPQLQGNLLCSPECGPVQCTQSSETWCTQHQVLPAAACIQITLRFRLGRGAQSLPQDLRWWVASQEPAFKQQLHPRTGGHSANVIFASLPNPFLSLPSFPCSSCFSFL